jgi:hypothetical protein
MQTIHTLVFITSLAINAQCMSPDLKHTIQNIAVICSNEQFDIELFPNVFVTMYTKRQTISQEYTQQAGCICQT